MTFREKLASEHPDKINDDCGGGCEGCPNDYGYEDRQNPDCNYGKFGCEKCWGREMPEIKTLEESFTRAGESAKITGDDLQMMGTAVGIDHPEKLGEIMSKTPAVNDHLEQPTIKDSGDRTEFSSGAVRDLHAGKGRMDLLPWAAIMEVSKHCENGALKYGEHNVDKGIPTSSLCDSAARHLAKYLDGWTDEPHLLAAAWNLLWAVQMELKNPEMVNTPWRGEINSDAEKNTV